MKNRLENLYELQMIDEQLDELEALRGDLPQAVYDLESEINGLQATIDEKEKEAKDSIVKKEKNETEIESLLESQKKYKSQLYQVRNNKEYDALTKEIDFTEEQIKRLETENDAMIERSRQLKEEIEEIKPKLDELKEELKDKEKDLEKIIKANEKEEVKLKEKREQLVKGIKKPDYNAYMRIRKAKRGKAVSTIKRSACSGCNNIVPPQRQLEIRRNNRIFFCEYCGRILVSNEIADSVEE